MKKSLIYLFICISILVFFNINNKLYAKKIWIKMNEVMKEHENEGFTKWLKRDFANSKYSEDVVFIPSPSVDPMERAVAGDIILHCFLLQYNIGGSKFDVYFVIFCIVVDECGTEVSENGTETKTAVFPYEGIPLFFHFEYKNYYFAHYIYDDIDQTSENYYKLKNYIFDFIDYNYKYTIK